MKINRIDYSRLSLWSHTDLAYIQHDPALDSFIAFVPGQSTLDDVIASRKAMPVDRSLLHQVLKKQYGRLGLPWPQSGDDLLDENTFTVTTAHQPVLLTGPLYHVYKIASTIHLANAYNANASGNKVIPVFVVSGEDHDWEEVNHVHLFGKKYEWQRDAGGPCGRLSLNGLDELIKTVLDVFPNSPNQAALREILTSSLDKAANYGDFHHLLVHALFGHHGLVVLNMDDPDLKRAFVPVMEREIKEQFSLPLVTATQKQLESAGFKAQAFCRPVNLFYMQEGRRERMELQDNGIKLVDSGEIKSMEDIIHDLHQHPDRFSPNVITRPLYQEYTLPNLAYIGGGGEIAYWLERKSQFKAAGIHYPMLIRRNSVMIIDSSTQQQLNKAELRWEDMLDEYDAIVKKYLKAHSQAELDYEEESRMLGDAYARLAAKAEKIDPTLAKAILAEETKQLKSFEQLGSRLIRAEKQLQETHLKRIQRLKEKLFPGGGLQERYENFLPYYAEYGDQWIASMIETCNPAEERFTILELS